MVPNIRFFLLAFLLLGASVEAPALLNTATAQAPPKRRSPPRQPPTTSSTPPTAKPSTAPRTQPGSSKNTSPLTSERRPPTRKRTRLDPPQRSEAADFAKHARREGRSRAAYRLYLRTRQAVVHIASLNGEGSGFFVSNDLIATNFHVIRDGRVFTVTTKKGHSSRATVISSFPDADLALLKLEKPLTDTQILALAEGLPKLASTVLAIGQPYAPYASNSRQGLGVLRWHWSVGHVTNRSKVKILTNANIYPGNSGGPLLNTAGEVVGIIHAIVGNRSGLALAIPVHYLRQLLKRKQNGYQKQLKTRLGLSVGSHISLSETSPTRLGFLFRLGFLLDEFMMTGLIRYSGSNLFGFNAEGLNSTEVISFGLSFGYRLRARLGLLALVFSFELGGLLVKRNTYEHRISLSPPDCKTRCIYKAERIQAGDEWGFELPLGIIWELGPIFLRAEFSLHPLAVQYSTVFLGAGIQF